MNIQCFRCCNTARISFHCIWMIFLVYLLELQPRMSDSLLSAEMRAEASRYFIHIQGKRCNENDLYTHQELLFTDFVYKLRKSTSHFYYQCYPSALLWRIKRTQNDISKFFELNKSYIIYKGNKITWTLMHELFKKSRIRKKKPNFY